MSENRPNPRRLAFKTLLRMESAADGGDGGYSNRLIDTTIEESGIEGADRALFCRLVSGVCERSITLDTIISSLAKRAVSKIDKEPLCLCRLGIYQLRYLDRIPEFAAVNETVKLAGRYSRGFVNAILRQYQRTPDFPVPDKQTDTVRYLSFVYSAPEELCARYLSLFGLCRTESILESYLESPPLTLRVNTLRTTRSELIERLLSDGFEATPTPHSPFGVSVRGQGLPRVIDEGLAFVQDESSQLASLVLDPKPTQRILDCCACPGGKSFSAALLSSDSAHILSCDLHPSKLPLISTGAERLGIKSIDTLVRDASLPLPEGEVYDRIICDVPCSGLGVVAKKTEIKYRPLASLSSLGELGYNILASVSSSLSDDGVLVYSTCTILPEENEEVVRRFIGTHQGFVCEDFTVGIFKSTCGMLTILPSRERDGFFIAKIRKVKKNALS